MKKEKYCDYSCKYADAEKLVPACWTMNPIYCKKYKKIHLKCAKCLDNIASINYAIGEKNDN